MTASMPLRIWLNHTYSTNYWIANMIKNNPDEVPFHIIMSGKDSSSPNLQAGDEAWLEPGEEMPLDQYAKWCLNFCVEHKVNVFIPMRGMVEIAKIRSMFVAHNIRVATSPSRSIDIFENKAVAYEAARLHGVRIPPYRVSKTSCGILGAYQEIRLQTGSNGVIIKPVSGVGASGFRNIVADKPNLSSLVGGATLDIDIETLYNLLTRAEDNGETIPEYMIMPWLDDPETSVDCLSDKNGKILTAIPRSKNGRIRVFPELKDGYDEMVEMAATLCNEFNLSYLTNSQFRWYEGHPVLLEVNTRISGGLYASALAGVNMPWECVKLMLNDGVNPNEQATVVNRGMQFTSVPSSVLMTRTEFQA